MLLGFFYSVKPDGPKVYLFHEILDDFSEVKSEFSISKASFSKFLQMQIAKANKSFDFNELADCIQNNKKDVANSFIVSFDDVYESVYTNAYPVLKKYKLSFILFITVELIDRPGYLSREQLIELSNDPLCIIGSHGCHHVLFRRLSKQEVEKELSDSKAILEKMTNRSVDIFAFPYGHVVAVSAKNVRQLKKSDYRFAFSALPGTLRQAWFTSNYFLPRINVDEKLVTAFNTSEKKEAS